jgi:hypothetical protein
VLYGTAEPAAERYGQSELMPDSAKDAPPLRLSSGQRAQNPNLQMVPLIRGQSGLREIDASSPQSYRTFKSRRYHARMTFQLGNSRLLAVLCLVLAGTMRAETQGSPVPANLTSAQIVAQLERRSQEEGLKEYKSVRHYQVEYHGFGTTLTAKMEVEVNFDASSGKSFRVVSQSGSKALLEKVLKRAVESEKEAAQNKGSTALTAANYRFRLAGCEDLGGRPAYVLDVEPLVASKFLYKGKIWVDGADFALVKIEAEPARNPSFWIARTLIRQTYGKTGNFWLPVQNRSETKVRVGGAAVFTIDYGAYQIVSNASY